jgi:1-deoxy-D-xylulose-5-phosphate synthase
MMERFPERALDVGIAEQHAVTLAAGMATDGLVVFCNIYSTFLQRAYDQVIHDVALQKLPVIFCLDRAGLVGQDGATHHGVYDLSYLNCIPNLIIYAPSSEIALRNIMYTAQLGLGQPIAIRYPRGRGRVINWKKPFEKLEIGKGHCVHQESGIAIITIGTMLHNALDALALTDVSASIYDIGFLKPIDTELLDSIFASYHTIITIEEGSIIGGLGTTVGDYALQTIDKLGRKTYNGKLIKLGVPDIFIEHGTPEELQEIAGISPKAIAKILRDISS